MVVLVAPELLSRRKIGGKDHRSLDSEFLPCATVWSGLCVQFGEHDDTVGDQGLFLC
jgi:hypothetical protein